MNWGDVFEVQQNNIWREIFNKIVAFKYFKYIILDIYL